MYARDYRDVIAGCALVVVGLSAAIYTLHTHDLGSPRHIGPGGFPTVLGLLLSGLGLLIAVPAYFRRGSIDPFAWRPFLTVCGAVLAFALTVRPLGLVPAIFALIIVSVLAVDRLGVVGTLVLASVLSFAAVAIFVLALGMPLPIFDWQF